MATAIGSKHKYAMTNRQCMLCSYKSILCNKGDLSVNYSIAYLEVLHRGCRWVLALGTTFLLPFGSADRESTPRLWYSQSRKKEKRIVYDVWYCVCFVYVCRQAMPRGSRVGAGCSQVERIKSTGYHTTYVLLVVSIHQIFFKRTPQTIIYY